MAVLTTAANRNEGPLLPRLVDAVAPIAQPDGLPRRRRPDKLHADKGYDSQDNRRQLEQRGIAPRIVPIDRWSKEKQALQALHDSAVRIALETGEKPPKLQPQKSITKLGRYRWVVERTLSWLRQFRRLRVRDERKGKLHRAFLLLACALINWRMSCSPAM